MTHLGMRVHAERQGLANRDGTGVAKFGDVGLGRQSRNQRSAPRVDVLLRLKGELVPLDVPIRMLNLSRTGFAVLSEARFRSGQRLHFRINGLNGGTVHVAAAAVHTEPRRDAPGVYLTGFRFIPVRSDAAVPTADIVRLLASVAPAGFKV